MVGNIRNGWCMLDGKPCVIPEGFTELEIFNYPIPEYNKDYETIEKIEYPNVTLKKWYVDYIIRPLTPQEIDERIHKFEQCSPRQFRVALLSKNPDPNYVDTLLNEIEDDTLRNTTKIEWEYSLEITKSSFLCRHIKFHLDMTHEEFDEFFVYANTL
jgi:hypothetical protein